MESVRALSSSGPMEIETTGEGQMTKVKASIAATNMYEAAAVTWCIESSPEASAARNQVVAQLHSGCA